mgnify:FL=1
MREEMKKSLTNKMTENLVVLRAKMDMTQAELADLIGTSRQTILSLEKKQRPMTWTTFLALLFVFRTNENTCDLLEMLGIYTDQLKDYLSK